MPRMLLMHIAPDSVQIAYCGKSNPTVSMYKYLSGYEVPDHYDDFCHCCEEHVYDNHPHPELIELQRIQL